MPGLVARYTSSRCYSWIAVLSLVGALAGAAAVGFAGPSHWTSMGNAIAIASGLCLIPAIFAAAFALRPAIEIHETHLDRKSVV